MKPAPQPLAENLRYRRAVIQAARGNIEFQRQCWIRASRDFVYFCNCYCWTFSIKDYPDQPVRPFILWDFQEAAAQLLSDAVGRHDMLIEKSRDMGVSWLNLALDLWRWTFRPNQSVLWGSRKEEYVDKTGDPKSLFWKYDFMLQRLPGWMQPGCLANKLHRGNLDNGCSLDGESTNDDFARGDRRAAIKLDEFAAVDNGHSILTATRDATRCRVFISTPQGAFGAFYDTRIKFEKTHPDWILRLHWSRHPDKRRGLYELNEDGTEYKILDQAYDFPPDFNFTKVQFPRFKLRSPWFNDECERAASEHEIAQELEIDYAGSGWRYFDPAVMDKIIARQAQPPLQTGEMVYVKFGHQFEFSEMRGGRLQLWFKPDIHGHVPEKFDVVVGCDIATGKGGEMSSNSVASGYDRRTGEKLFQFTTNAMLPAEFADYVLAICRWMHDAFLIWEANGPGGEFTKHVGESGYRRVFYGEDETVFIRKKTRKPGFWTTKDSKRILLAGYFNALKSDKCLNRCLEALKECGEYVHNTDGTIVHSRAVSSIDPTATGENHGDMVISDALAWRGIIDVPVIEDASVVEAPIGSFLARRQEAERKGKRKLAKVYY